MIDDATLSCHDHGNCELCDHQEAEIRRLREEQNRLQGELEGYQESALNTNQWESNLAAHLAVVRELAETIESTLRDCQGVYAGGHGHRLITLLAHPLVQQAREEKES
mgnify:CR=1 FL=1